MDTATVPSSLAGFVVESEGRRYLFTWEELKTVALLIWRVVSAPDSHEHPSRP